MKAFLFLICSALSVSVPGWTQTRVPVSGYVRDAQTGETLVGATVQAAGTGVVTNNYGFYSLSLPDSVRTLQVSFVGYQTVRIQRSRQSGQQNITLQAIPGQLQEVTVKEQNPTDNVEKNQMSVVRLDAKTIRQVPAVLGEADVFKTLQLLPGVSTVADGAAGFNVRGGSVDQNLILLDEATLYNPTHLLGLYSSVNPDAVKDIQLYKGGIPARYGGRVSSVLDIRQREGNARTFRAEGGVGLIAARALVEGPLLKNKSSFMLSARRSYGDVFLSLIDNKSIAYFYDLNLKTNLTINPANQLFLSGYFGRDRLALGGLYNNGWGNATGTLRWNHIFSPSLFANFSAIYSNYDYSIDLLTTGTQYNRRSNIITAEAKGDFTWYMAPRRQLEFGFSQRWYEFRPGRIRPIGGSSVAPFSLADKQALERAAYVSFEQRWSALTITAGVRYSQFVRRGSEVIRQYDNNRPVVYDRIRNRYSEGTVTGERTYRPKEAITTYSYPEPRFALTYRLAADQSVKASFNRTYQYLHLVSNTTSPTPIDVWTPSGPYLKPQRADQVALGYFRNFSENRYEASLETYYKWLTNQIDYVDGADLLLNNYLETQLLSGQGRAYGLEVYLKKNTGRLTGWLSYTLARTERKVPGLGQDDPGINQGAYYPTNFDKRHNLSLTGSYSLSDRWTLSSNFVFATGIPGTFPTARYEYANLAVAQFENRNQQRLPAYHRLDLSATLKSKTTQRHKREWVFGLYNVYNRANATSIYFIEDEEQRGKTTAYKSYLLGITPSVTYNRTF